MLVDQNIIFGYKKPKSLQDILVHTNIFGNSSRRMPKPKCNRNKCRHCPLIDKSGEVTSSSTGRKYRSMVNVMCNSSNLIYLIECTICKIEYVGQTKNKILVRMNQHYSSIKNKLETPVSRYFNSHTLRDSTPLEIIFLPWLEKMLIL